MKLTFFQNNPTNNKIFFFLIQSHIYWLILKYLNKGFVALSMKTPKSEPKFLFQTSSLKTEPNWALVKVCVSFFLFPSKTRNITLSAFLFPQSPLLSQNGNISPKPHAQETLSDFLTIKIFTFTLFWPSSNLLVNLLVRFLFLYVFGLCLIFYLPPSTNSIHLNCRRRPFFRR